MRCFPIISIGLTCAFAAVSVANGQVAFRKIAVTGDAAPGTPEGVTFSSLARPSINDSGLVAFSSILQGEGVNSFNSRTLFVGNRESPQLLVRAGSPIVPTNPGVNFSNNSSPLTLADDGYVSFSAQLAGSVTTTSNTGIYAGRPGNLMQLAREGDQAAGMSTGVRYSDQREAPSLNDFGQVAYVAELTNSPVPVDFHMAIYAGEIANPLVVARTRDTAHGLPENVKYHSLDKPSLNDTGQLTYAAFLIGVDVTPETNRAIFLKDAAAPRVIARRGSAAPGLNGVNFGEFDRPHLTDSGQLTFWSRLVGSSVTTSNDSAIFTGKSGVMQLAVREGDPAPGLGSGVFYGIPSNLPAVNDADQMAFSVTLVGNGVTSLNNSAMYVGRPGQFELVAREGDLAPGLGPGVRYSDLFNAPSFNDRGQGVYRVNLVGDGVNGTNDTGFFGFDPQLGHFLIARQGDLFNVGPGDARIIQDFDLAESPTDDAYATSLSNRGEVAFLIYFTDGSTGAFVATIPEPALASLLTLFFPLLSRRRVA